MPVLIGIVDGRCDPRQVVVGFDHLARDAHDVEIGLHRADADPVGVLIETFGTETVPVDKLERAIREVFDFRPKAMIDQLNLRRPIFNATAAYGHFGRSGEGFTWELTDRVEALKAAL